MPKWMAPSLIVGHDHWRWFPYIHFDIFMSCWSGKFRSWLIFVLVAKYENWTYEIFPIQTPPLLFDATRCDLLLAVTCFSLVCASVKFHWCGQFYEIWRGENLTHKSSTHESFQHEKFLIYLLSPNFFVSFVQQSKNLEEQKISCTKFLELWYIAMKHTEARREVKLVLF